MEKKRKAADRVGFYCLERALSAFLSLFHSFLLTAFSQQQQQQAGTRHKPQQISRSQLFALSLMKATFKQASKQTNSTSASSSQVARIVCDSQAAAAAASNQANERTSSKRSNVERARANLCVFKWKRWLVAERASELRSRSSSFLAKPAAAASEAAQTVRALPVGARD